MLLKFCWITCQTVTGMKCIMSSRLGYVSNLQAGLTLNLSAEHKLSIPQVLICWGSIQSGDLTGIEVVSRIELFPNLPKLVPLHTGTRTFSLFSRILSLTRSGIHPGPLISKAVDFTTMLQGQVNNSALTINSFNQVSDDFFFFFFFASFKCFTDSKKRGNFWHSFAKIAGNKRF